MAGRKIRILFQSSMFIVVTFIIYTGNDIFVPHVIAKPDERVTQQHVRKDQSITQDTLRRFCYQRKGNNESLETSTEESKSVEMSAASLPKAVLQRLMVDERHRVVYCPVPKVGCSTWKARMMSASGKELPQARINLHDARRQEAYGIRHLLSYNTTQQNHILSSYFKFIFVRHPLTRLVSAFRNKLQGKPEFQEAAKIMWRYNHDAKPYNYTLTMSDFINYVVHSPAKLWAHNEHWESYDTLCSPCLVKYDFIGRFEHFKRDSQFVVDKAYESYKDVDPMSVTKGNRTKSDVEATKLYFANVNVDLRKKVVEHFHTDFSLFGYNYRDIFTDFIL